MAVKSWVDRSTNSQPSYLPIKLKYVNQYFLVYYIFVLNF